MPMILWAYPREFKDKSSASQNLNNPNEFTYPYYGSMVYWAGLQKDMLSLMMHLFQLLEKI